MFRSLSAPARVTALLLLLSSCTSALSWAGPALLSRGVADLATGVRSGLSVLSLLTMLAVFRWAPGKARLGGVAVVLYLAFSVWASQPHVSGSFYLENARYLWLAAEGGLLLALGGLALGTSDRVGMGLVGAMFFLMTAHTVAPSPWLWLASAVLEVAFFARVGLSGPPVMARGWVFRLPLVMLSLPLLYALFQLFLLGSSVSYDNYFRTVALGRVLTVSLFAQLMLALAAFAWARRTGLVSAALAGVGFVFFAPLGWVAWIQASRTSARLAGAHGARAAFDHAALSLALVLGFQVVVLLMQEPVLSLVLALGTLVLSVVWLVEVVRGSYLLARALDAGSELTADLDRGDLQLAL